MAWLTSQRKRQARFSLQLKLNNPFKFNFISTPLYNKKNKITWCILNLIQNHQHQTWDSDKQPDTATQLHIPKVQQQVGEGHATHHTAVVGKNHFLCYKAWQLLPTYFLFCCEGRMSQIRPVQLPVPFLVHII